MARPKSPRTRKITNKLQLEHLEPRQLMTATMFDRDPSNPPLMASSIYNSPLRRIRPGDARGVTPPDGSVLTPPVLPGSTKVVKLNLFGASGKTAKPLGVNIDQLTSYAQGNAINSIIPHVGTFELGSGRIMVHTAATGSTTSKLVVDSSWIFSKIGLSTPVGQYITGNTGANAHRSYLITDVQEQRDAQNNLTGRVVITIDGSFAFTPIDDNSFFITLKNYSNVPLADRIDSVGNVAVVRDNGTAHSGQSSALFTFGAGTGNTGTMQNWMGADNLAGRNVFQKGHTYQMSFWAKTSGPATATPSLYQGGNHKSSTINLIADGEWHQYTLTMTATAAETYGNGIVNLLISGTSTQVNIDDLKVIDLTDQYSEDSTISKTVVDLINDYGFSMMRFWHPNLLPATLDDLIGPAEARPTVIGPSSNYSPQLGLPEMLELAKATNSTPWIVLPTTWSPDEMHNLLEYLGGDVNTVYGAKRAADGHADSWFTDLPGIKLEAGNESWNNTFAPYSYSPFEPYFERAQDMFHAVKSDALYTSEVAGKLKLIVNGWQWVPWYTKTSQDAVPAADAVDVSAYTSGPNTQMPIKDLLGGVMSQSLQENSTHYPSYIFGKEVYVYEEASGELGNTVSSGLESAYKTSLGAALAVIRNSMVLTRDFGMSTQNLFTMFQRGLYMSNGYALGHYGIFSDMGTADTNPRPVALAASLLNRASGTIISSTLTNGWVVDAASPIAGARTTQAADALVTLDGNKLVITLFNNTVSDSLNTAFNLVLPEVLAGRTINPDWNNASFTVLSAPSVASNNETSANVTLGAGQFTYKANELYAALPAHSMGSLVIPLL
jgi:hypothetical protein